MTLLERLAAYAWEHGAPSRINYDNGDISVLITWREMLTGRRGATWYHAATYRELRSILGY